jgi:NADH-quinone oxidoreductase subunit H
MSAFAAADTVSDVAPGFGGQPVWIVLIKVDAVLAFLAFAVIPLGPTGSLFEHHTPLQLTDLPVGVLLIFACSSLGVSGIVLAGWPRVRVTRCSAACARPRR